MDVTTPITPFFSFLHFLCREQGKSALFSLVSFLSWYHTPLSSLAVKRSKLMPLIGVFLFRYNPSTSAVVPPGDGLADQPRKSFSCAFLAGGQSSVPRPAYKGFTVPFSVSKATTKPPPFVKHFPIFREMEPDNVSGSLPSCPST